MSRSVSEGGSASELERHVDLASNVDCRCACVGKRQTAQCHEEIIGAIHNERAVRGTARDDIRHVDKRRIDDDFSAGVGHGHARAGKGVDNRHGTAVKSDINGVARWRLGRRWIFLEESDAVELRDGEGIGATFGIDDHHRGTMALEDDFRNLVDIVIVDDAARTVQVDMVFLGLEADATQQKGK